MQKCPFFGKCGGCKFDFASDSYRNEKLQLLRNIPTTEEPIWIDVGTRRRGDFAFYDNKFGFYKAGSKNIIPIQHCPIMTPEINKILPDIAALPFSGSGSALITACDNGIDVAINSPVPYFNSEFKKAAEKLPAIRITWNDKIVKQTAAPVIKFGDKIVEYPSSAFLQPSVEGEEVLRNLVKKYAGPAKKVVDLFCGLGSFTFSLNAIGYDIAGLGSSRDLLKKPLHAKELNKYDCVVMDPPRGGAAAQIAQIAKSDIKKVIYVSCSFDTFMRDKKILEQGDFVLSELIPVDQFIGSDNWELVGLFIKK